MKTPLSRTTEASCAQPVCKVVVLGFFARPTKKQSRERTCYKPPPNQLGCSGLWEGFLQAARICAEHLGSWKLLLPVLRAFLEAGAAGGHSTDLQLVLNHHCQNGPYNHHQIAVMSKILLPNNLSKAWEYKWWGTHVGKYNWDQGIVCLCRVYRILS